MGLNEHLNGSLFSWWSWSWVGIASSFDMPSNLNPGVLLGLTLGNKLLLVLHPPPASMSPHKKATHHNHDLVIKPELS